MSETSNVASAAYIQTIEGIHFPFLDPKPEHVSFWDIAHALSMTCRFAGHVQRFYCPTPDQRVLTADLRWIPAGDLKKGDSLVGFDEYPVKTNDNPKTKSRRHFRPSVVLTALPVKRKVYRLEMEDGSTVTSSVEHPWLIATKQSRNQTWLSTNDIAKAIHDGRNRYMHRFVNVWKVDNSYDAGWLAGMYDGEGYISFRDRKGFQMGIAQRPGLVLDRLTKMLDQRAFHGLRYSWVGSRGVVNTQLNGGWREVMRLLDSLRPVRLLDKFVQGLQADELGKRLDGMGSPLKIVKAYYEGEQWVAGLETSTRTYFCEGFGAHNSVAEHSVRVSYACDPKDALWGLLHDAAEAYLPDLARPIKLQMPEYQAMENRIQAAIIEKYGLDSVEPTSVTHADRVLLATEARDLCAPGWEEWGIGVDPLPERIVPWNQQQGKQMFLKRFAELAGPF